MSKVIVLFMNDDGEFRLETVDSEDYVVITEDEEESDYKRNYHDGMDREWGE